MTFGTRAKRCCWRRTFIRGVVQEILGHSQISLTLDTYSHVLPHVNEDAAQQMDTALRA